MDKFYVITNCLKDEKLETTGEIKSYLEKYGKICILQEESGFGRSLKYRFTDAEKIPEDVECIIVLGGDGTLIQAARDTIHKQIPLLGINMGTLGYLAEIDKDNISTALDHLIMDEYTLERRMMLKGIGYRGDESIVEDIALNDIFIGRNGHVRMINLNIYVNNEYLCSYNADGVVISTPTGSTGYSLSAGGPIIAPSASMILMTPVAPHTLNSRSIVFSANDIIEVEIGKGHKTVTEEAEVTFDGDTFKKLITGDRIRISKSTNDTKTVKISNISFLEILRKKMSSS